MTPECKVADIIAYRSKTRGPGNRPRLDEAIGFDPDSARLYACRGDAFLRNRQADKALDDYNHAIAIDPTSSLAFLGRGEVYFRMRDHDRAIEDFSEAVKLFPGNARAYLRRGAEKRSRCPDEGRVQSRGRNPR